MKQLSRVFGEQKVLVKELACGFKFKKRAMTLGITPGTEIEICQNNGGQIIIKVRGSKLAIGKGFASKILVKQKTGEEE